MFDDINAVLLTEHTNSRTAQRKSSLADITFSSALVEGRSGIMFGGR